MGGMQRSEASEGRARGRGRPRQSESEVGRDKLIERTRVAMNLRPRTDIQRREIAEAIGVTPALITYYFPDKWSLMEAAAQPIMMAHVAAVEDILSYSNSIEEKLRALIKIYLDFSKCHGHMLEYYIFASEQISKPENIEKIRRTHTLIVQFFRDGIRDGAFGVADPEVLQSSLWSICQCLGKKLGDKQPSAYSPISRSSVAESYQNLIFDLFSKGVMQSAAVSSAAEGCNEIGGQNFDRRR